MFSSRHVELISEVVSAALRLQDSQQSSKHFLLKCSSKTSPKSLLVICGEKKLVNVVYVYLELKKIR